MNTYECTKCEYIAKRRIDLDRHFLSLKHQQKVQEQSVDSSKGCQSVLIESPRKSLEYKCFFCNNVYKSAGNLTKHIKICGKKQYDELHYNRKLEEEIKRVSKLLANLKGAVEIQKLIDDKILANDIIKYITPYFYLNKNDELIAIT
jgi:hypothetical protein